MRLGERPGRLAAAFVFLAAATPGLARAAVETRSGTIAILTADDFEHGRSERIVALADERGARSSLDLPPGSQAPPPGTHVRVHGTPGAGRFSVDELEVLEDPGAAASPSVSGNSTVIAILVKFLDTAAEPYTVPQIQARMFGAGNVSDYYKEVSYGSHTLSGTVTNWLTATINTPTTCDPYSVSAQADARAADAGYNPYAYQKRVYVFPHIPCGWSGLGGGSQAWINQAASNLVVGHELGHCFGVGHSSSLDCGATVLESPCTVSEYGDPFSIMGNSQARHFPAYMKSQLGYLPAGTKAIHGGGMAIYTLDPIEQAGGSLYAVQVSLIAPQRTYWIEYRQPIGFDGTMSGNPVSGAMIRLAPGYPAFSCSTCLLDMTPTDAGFGNAALVVGETYVDAEAGLRVTPLSADASSLVVEIELGPSPELGVDRHPLGANPYPNGVLESGETATVEPSYFNAGGSPVPMTGTATSFTGPGPGATYSITDAAADYGDVPAGQLASCFDATGNCYSVTAYAAARPALHWDAAFEETLSDTSVRSWPIHIGRSFADVASTRGDYRYVETVLHKGITSGCGGTSFCPDGTLSRAQMAVFLLRAEHGSAYVPPAATGLVFGDVPAGSFAAAWIERLAAEGITAGCGGGANFCPNDPVTRAQMAVFLLKTEHGSSWTPPSASGDFSDVPVGNPFAPWVEALKDEGVTAGCGAGLYCPNAATRRGQMAVFLTKGFQLNLYGP